MLRESWRGVTLEGRLSDPEKAVGSCFLNRLMRGRSDSSEDSTSNPNKSRK